jgi:arylsulfatase A-like enzyme
MGENLQVLPKKGSGQPNFVFILVDDMAWYGTAVRMNAELPASGMAFCSMPNVEKLSEQGIVFSHARAAAAMCGPSRCSIQTGMTAAHHLYSGNGGFGLKTDGNVKYIAERGQPPLLTPEPQGNIRFPSIGDVLRSNGYSTAHFGKWHLYGGGPEKHGYDESNGETDNKSVNDVPSGDKVENPKQIFSITQSGISFMERQQKAGKPFFLQLSHYATHARYESRPATLKKYENNPAFNQITDKRVAKNAIELAAMMEDLDTSIGMIMNKIDNLGISSNTFVVFVSDNGYRSWNQGAEPLRGGKWWIWDGGLRVPMIVRGPGIKPDSRCDVNVVGYDFLPTIADLAGASASLPKAVDGVSFKPLLLGQSVPESYVNRPIFFHYPHYREAAPASALVVGQMKMIYFYDHPDQHFQFDLEMDPGEKNNISTTFSDKARLMYQQLMEGLKSFGAYFPKPNPAADPNTKIYDPNNLAETTSNMDDLMSQ